MSNAGKKTTVKDELVAPQIKLEEEQKGAAVSVKQQIEAYLQRKAEVTQSDHQAFQDYLNQKAQALPAPQDAAAPEQPSKFNRRNLLKVVAGTAVAGEAAAATYSWVTSGSASDQGARNAGARYAEAQRENIERTLIDSKSDVGGRGLGKWIALLPTKLGGGTYALDLNTNRVLSSIWYWTYGDFNPISHHLCAFPSADPYHSFEFINSTQGGKNCLIYGINTRMEAPEPGFNIYRVSATTARKWS
jgi:thiocyanate desulfurase